MSGSDLASKRKRKREDYPFHLEYRTRWSDNDVYAHLNNSVYAFLIDSIVNAYLISHCSLNPSPSAHDPTTTFTSPTSSTQIGLVVSSYCDFFGSVAYPAVVDLGLRVLKLGKSSVLYEVGVFEQGQEGAKAVGGFIHVFVEREGRRPAEGGMEDGVRRGLESIMVRETAKL